MIFSRNFRITPRGKVKGGDVQYVENTETGDLTYSGRITVGVWPFSKTLATDGQYEVDPTMLLSSSVSEVGKVIQIGNATFTVYRVADDYSSAMVEIAVKDKPMKARATLDLSGTHFMVDDIVAEVDVTLLGTLVIELLPIWRRTR